MQETIPPGTLIPADPDVQEKIPVVQVNGTSIEQLRTKEEAIAFIRAHTEQASALRGTGLYANGTIIRQGATIFIGEEGLNVTHAMNQAFYEPAPGWSGWNAAAVDLNPVPTMVPGTVAPSADRDYSKTNVQVKDVDEADIIKTDGTNIYVVINNCMHIIKAYPAKDAKILSTLRFAGHPLALYTSGDRVVLVATDTWTRPISPCTPGKCSWYPASKQRTLVYVFSVKNASNPQLVRELDIDGSYTSSRMIGTQLYFVTGTTIPYPPDYLELPTINDDHGGIMTPPVYGFNTIDRAFTFSTIGSMDVAGTSAVPAKTFIIGTAGTVYVSPARLYIAAADRRVPGVRPTTIHAFAIDNGTISYAASGKVDGTLLSQYSLDEYNGNLRVATTIPAGFSQGKAGPYSQVTVLDRNLAVLGTLPDIAPTEQIYAARFMGDRLYLVTFRQTDPFFVIGLADPKKPVILGELKIPGYSSYLHPYDQDHLIGIGKESASGMVKMALFDVSDVSNPVLKDSVSLGSSYSTSPVLDDPKAFLFDREKNLLVLPVQLQSPRTCPVKGACIAGTFWGGAYVYGVNPKSGFVLKGTVQHYNSTYGNRGSGFTSPVKRSLYIDDTLYTMADDMMMMSDLAHSLAEVNVIDFQ